MRAGAKGDVRKVGTVGDLGQILPNLARFPILLEGFFQRGALTRLFVRRVENTAAELGCKETANTNRNSEVDCGATKFGEVFVCHVSIRLLQMRRCGVARGLEPVGYFERRVFPTALLLQQLPN